MPMAVALMPTVATMTMFTAAIIATKPDKIADRDYFDSDISFFNTSQSRQAKRLCAPWRSK
jgi:hypothetical protein